MPLQNLPASEWVRDETRKRLFIGLSGFKLNLNLFLHNNGFIRVKKWGRGLDDFTFQQISKVDAKPVWSD